MVYHSSTLQLASFNSDRFLTDYSGEQEVHLWLLFRGAWNLASPGGAPIHVPSTAPEVQAALAQRLAQ